MSKLIVYGIPNCDTTQKAVSLFKKNNIGFEIHDYKQKGITDKKLKEWISKAGLEKVFNKRSTTYKDLGEKEKAAAVTENGAIKIMLEHNSIIKRPIIEAGNDLVIGYDEKKLNNIL